MSAPSARGTPVPAINGLRINNAVADEAHRILCQRLTCLGSSLDDAHVDGLRALSYLYLHTAIGVGSVTKRTACALQVGRGKTQSAAAVAAAFCQRQARDLSLMVAQNAIESLCSLKRDMIEIGVPEECIALVHTKRFKPEHADACRNLKGPDGYASEPSLPKDADTSGYPVLLLSHEMLKARQDIHEFNAYRGGERSLVIWDETLVKSAGRSLSLLNVDIAVGALRKRVEWSKEPNETADAAVRYLECCIALLKRHLEEQTDDPRTHRAERLPEKTADELHAYMEALRAIKTTVKDATRADHLSLIERFLAFSQEKLRVVRVRDGALIQYDLLIPPTLKRVVVLDASHNIRELVSKYDSDIVEANAELGTTDCVNVTINHLKHAAGRKSLDGALTQKNSHMLRALVERIKSYSDDRGVLMFTYKPRSKGLDHAALIQRALRAAGVDTTATLANGKPRFAWLTWGQELGLSSYSYCEHVMLVGIYRKPREVLASQIAGQLEDLDAPEAGCSTAIREVELSEIFHSLYQAAGRGQCRVTEHGKAKPMQLDFIGPDDFPVRYWQEAFPNATKRAWKSKHLTKETVTEQAAEAIAEYLSKVAPQVEYVSCRTLKPAAGLGAVDRKGFTRARRVLGRMKGMGWTYVKDRRGYLRCPFA